MAMQGDSILADLAVIEQDMQNIKNGIARSSEESYFDLADEYEHASKKVEALQTHISRVIAGDVSKELLRSITEKYGRITAISRELRQIFSSATGAGASVGAASAASAGAGSGVGASTRVPAHNPGGDLTANDLTSSTHVRPHPRERPSVHAQAHTSGSGSGADHRPADAAGAAGAAAPTDPLQPHHSLYRSLLAEDARVPRAAAVPSQSRVREATTTLYGGVASLREQLRRINHILKDTDLDGRPGDAGAGGGAEGDARTRSAAAAVKQISADLRRKNRSLEEELGDQRGRADLLDRENRELRGAVADLKAELGAAADELSILRNSHRHLANERTSSKEFMEKADGELHRLRVQAETQKVELRALRAKYAADTRALQERAAETEADAKALRQRNARLAEKLGELNELDVESAALEVRRATQTCAMLEGVIVDLKARLADTRTAAASEREELLATIAVLEGERADRQRAVAGSGAGLDAGFDAGSGLGLGAQAYSPAASYTRAARDPAARIIDEQNDLIRRLTSEIDDIKAEKGQIQSQVSQAIGCIGYLSRSGLHGDGLENGDAMAEVMARGAARGDLAHSRARAPIRSMLQTQAMASAVAGTGVSGTFAASPGPRSDDEDLTLFVRNQAEQIRRNK